MLNPMESFKEGRSEDWDSKLGEYRVDAIAAVLLYNPRRGSVHGHNAPPLLN